MANHSGAYRRIEWWARVPDLGLVSDAVIAERLGVPRTTVRAARERLGLPCPSLRVDWSEIDFSDHDDVTAAMLGVSVRTVRKRRVDSGINKHAGRTDRWDHDALLGTVPDVIVAYLRGVERGSAAAARVRRRLPTPVITIAPIPLTGAMHKALRKRYPKTTTSVAAWLVLARALGVHHDTHTDR